MRYLIPTLFMAIVLIGCDKGDPAPASIIGKWNITKVKTTSQVGGQSLVDMLVASGMTEAEAQQAITQAQGGIDITGQFSGTLEFKSDGTWTGTAISDDDNGESTGTWELSSDGKTLSLLSDGQSSDGDEGAEPDTVTVASVTATDLQLDMTVPGDEADLPIDITISISFKRL